MIGEIKMDTKEFKSVIEDIVDAKMARKGITKFMSAVVKTVHEDGSVDVYLPPDKARTISNVLNKTGENLYEGDSVELCAKNGKPSNAWVSVKHGTNFNVDKQTTDTGWLYTSNMHSSALGAWYNYGLGGTLYGRKIGNIVELNSELRFDGGEIEPVIFQLNEAFRPTQKIYATLRVITLGDGAVGNSVNISIDTNGNITIEDGFIMNEIAQAAMAMYLYGNIMYFI